MTEDLVESILHPKLQDAPKIAEINEVDKQITEINDKIMLVQKRTVQLTESLPRLIEQLESLDAVETRLLELVIAKLEKK